ncbi:hypothetical protein GSI_06492 [Ganoderma sinense ZZ0214-1]|uniref:Uncharacterized protein n=1 Tax=Ganoderma sinense ZZ0214-1 TaxID=1077348 RepID=A0A2G8SDY2_9APHY|nr:hypothetical protein GSI_06492 [Ganoderma sinense ZZ0214-1]
MKPYGRKNGEHGNTSCKHDGTRVGERGCMLSECKRVALRGGRTSNDLPSLLEPELLLVLLLPFMSLCAYRGCDLGIGGDVEVGGAVREPRKINMPVLQQELVVDEHAPRTLPQPPDSEDSRGRR